MRIEEGKFYRTRDGRKVGPMRIECRGIEWEFEAEVDGQRVVDGAYCAWRADGSFNPFDRNPHRLDLISEWTEGGPVVTKTVTTRRIEPGVYGPLHVGVQDNQGYPVLLSFAGKLTGKPISSGVGFNAPELRELARVALEIAEYLDAK